ncbi:MAG: YihY/virulence factor BrkB family protein [Oscillospiraceae bacterium]|nr:YihY/virulence factor BrkB family protein [Oscillospiraceae bacterium]
MKEKLRCALQNFSLYQISVYAGNAAFFLLLSVFPAATLLLGLLQLLSIDSGKLLELLTQVLPDVAIPAFRYVFGVNNPIAVISISAVTAVWSASRGTYGVLRGLNRAFALDETRGYLRVRLACVLDTLLLLAAVLVALLLYVFGNRAAAALRAWPLGVLVYPLCRFLVTTAALILLFALVYQAMPDHHVRFAAVLPGAVFAGAGWMAFSALYSVYVTQFSNMDKLYGGLSAVAITMLWLYSCMEILFLGGVLNHCHGQ